MTLSIGMRGKHRTSGGTERFHPSYDRRFLHGRTGQEMSKVGRCPIFVRRQGSSRLPAPARSLSCRKRSAV